MNVMREKFQKIVESKFGALADKICNSVWYIVAYGLVCILAHSFDIPVVGAVLLTLLLVPALLFCKNSFVLTPFLTMCMFVMSEETKPQSGYFGKPLYIVVLCFALVFILTAFVFNFIYYKKWRSIFKRGYLTISLALVTGFLMVGGLGAPSISWTGVGMALAISVTMFLPYTLLINCGEYEGRKTIEYFAWSMITVAVVIFAAVIKQYVMYDLSLSYHPKELIEFGYAISNTAATFVLISIPITFYMVYIYKHGYAFMFVIALELITIFLTYSRAVYVVVFPGTVIVSIALCFKKKTGRLGYYIVFGLAVVACLALVIVFRSQVFSQIAGLFSGDSTGSGRTSLWTNGFNAWKSYPIFGLGIWYLPPINNWYYSFHCTPLTYLYCTGIVGLAAYLYHRYRTVRLVFNAKLTPERVFTALCVLALLCNSLLDIAMTMPPHLLYYGIMLALIESDVKKTKGVDSLTTKFIWQRRKKNVLTAIDKASDNNVETENTQSENANTTEGENNG